MRGGGAQPDQANLHTRAAIREQNVPRAYIYLPVRQENESKTIRSQSSDLQLCFTTSRN
jgi:hypothetical protein